MAKKKFYITTTAPYVNADPHIGFALELIQSDALARFKKLAGFDVAFGFGTDEHGLKIYRKALEAKKSPQEYCDKNAKKYDSLKKSLDLSATHFIRTTDPHHIEAAQEFWTRCYKNGDIYKKNYRIKYCVGCELEKTDSELVGGRCPIHPNLSIESYREENYFFRFAKYQNRLLTFYEKNPDFVIPNYRFKEIKDFVKKGLQDFSVSRLKEKMPWGVAVPGDKKHVMYVWFDALVFYISTLGWPKKLEEYKKWWPGVQVAGKDNLRQQTAIWQAMLMSAGLPNSKQVFIHGFITSEGQKISKSLGNVIDPIALIKQYGIDAVRYYLLKEIPPFEDGDFSHSRMKEVYNSDLANELGNLITRISHLCEQAKIDYQEESDPELLHSIQVGGFKEHVENFQFNLALEELWKDIKDLNAKVNNEKPWEKNNTGLLKNYVRIIRKIAYWLQLFMPNTGERILESTQGKIKKIAPLFPRL